MKGRFGAMWVCKEEKINHKSHNTRSRCLHLSQQAPGLLSTLTPAPARHWCHAQLSVMRGQSREVHSDVSQPSEGDQCHVVLSTALVVQVCTTPLLRPELCSPM